MRNTWKGLFVGGLTGALAGVVLDALARGSRRATQLGGQLRDHAPQVADHLRTAATQSVARLQDTELPARVRQAAHQVAHSDTAEHMKDAVEAAVTKGRHNGDELAESKDSNAISKGRGKVRRAVDKG